MGWGGGENFQTDDRPRTTVKKRSGEWSDGAVLHGARFDEGTSVILEEIFLPARFG